MGWLADSYEPKAGVLRETNATGASVSSNQQEEAVHEDLHKRGVAPKVAEGAFFEYDDKAPIPSEHIWVGDPYQPFGEERDALDPKEIAAAIRAHTSARRGTRAD